MTAGFQPGYCQAQEILYQINQSPNHVVPVAKANVKALLVTSSKAPTVGFVSKKSLA